MKQDIDQINVIPLVDVMLVLLIIFMVSIPPATIAIKVDLPPAQNTTLVVVATNATLTHTGAKSALLTTEGVRDALAAHVEAVGVRELSGVAVGRPGHPHNHVALRHRAVAVHDEFTTATQREPIHRGHRRHHRVLPGLRRGLELLDHAFDLGQAPGHHPQQLGRQREGAGFDGALEDMADAGMRGAKGQRARRRTQPHLHLGQAQRVLRQPARGPRSSCRPASAPAEPRRGNSRALRKWRPGPRGGTFLYIERAALDMQG